MAPNPPPRPATAPEARRWGRHTLVAVAALGLAAPALACGTGDVVSSPPVGVLEDARAGPGTIAVHGWALDPGSSSPVTVEVWVDDEASTVAAATDSGAAAAAFPALGAGHGFATVVAASGGPHEVCATALGVDGRMASPLGCLRVVVPAGDPVGAVDVVSGADDSVEVTGWAFDPEEPGPVRVVVEWQGLERTVVASDDRPDVEAAFPGLRGPHGFHVTFPADLAEPAVAEPEVCVRAVDVGPGDDTALGCRRVEVVPAYTGAPGGRRVAVLGNSITALSLDELTAALGDVYRSSVAGRSGRTTAGLLPLAAQYAATDPDVVVIEAGSNDAGLPEGQWSGLAVLATQGEMLAAVPGARCVVWVDITTHTGREPFDSHARLVDAGVAYWQAHDARLVIAGWDAATAGRRDLLIDGVHPNGRGQRTLAAVVRDAVGRCPA